MNRYIIDFPLYTFCPNLWKMCLRFQQKKKPFQVELQTKLLSLWSYWTSTSYFCDDDEKIWVWPVMFSAESPVLRKIHMSNKLIPQYGSVNKSAFICYFPMYTVALLAAPFMARVVCEVFRSCEISIVIASTEISVIISATLRSSILLF